MDDRLKQQLMIGLLCFNFTVIAYMAYWFFVVQQGPVTWGLFARHAAIGAGIGIVPFIVGYFIGRAMYK